MKKYKILLYILIFLNILPVIFLISAFIFLKLNIEYLFYMVFNIFFLYIFWKIYIIDTIALTAFYLYTFIKRRINPSVLYIEVAALSVVISIGVDIASHYLYSGFMSI